MITTGNLPRSLQPGVKQFTGMGYKEYPAMWNKMFEVMSSEKAYELFVGTVSTGLAPQKTPGSAVAYDTIGTGWETRFNNITVALGLQVTDEAVADNQYPELVKLLGGQSKSLGRSIRRTEEVMAANIFNRAFSGSYLGADGICMISTAHVKKSDGTTYANAPSAAMDISEAALEQASIDIAKFQDERGNRIMAQPKTCIVPPDLRFELVRILKSAQQNDTANNAVNALKESGVFSGEPVINPYLSDVDAWFIRTDVPSGLIFIDREGLKTSIDNLPGLLAAAFINSRRFSVGWHDPLGVYGSAGA